MVRTQLVELGLQPHHRDFLRDACIMLLVVRDDERNVVTVLFLHERVILFGVGTNDFLLNRRFIFDNFSRVVILGAIKGRIRQTTFASLGHHS